MRFLLLLLLPLVLCLLLLQPCVSDIDPCANSTNSHSGYVDGALYCHFYNFTLTSNVSQNFAPTFQDPSTVITLTNVHLTVLNVSAPSYPFINQIILSAFWTSSVVLVNTTLHAPFVWIRGGGSVIIHNTTHLSADGFAPSGLLTNPMPSESNATAGTGGGGGGGGGIGGYGCDRNAARGGAATGDPVTPPLISQRLDYSGPGSVATNTTEPAAGFGLGGGFVLIQAGQRTPGDLTLAGTITANGTDATHPTLPAGGGAGGFVSLQVPYGRIVGADDGKVEANGGSAANGGGGGAGGRIYIDGGIDSYTVRAYGGSSGGNCQGGGQGTIYSVTHKRTGNDTGFAELRCVGQDSTSPSAATDFSNSSTVDRLDLTHCQLIANGTVHISQQLTMIASNLQTHQLTDGSGISTLHISVPLLETSSDSSIAADRLLIEVDTLKLGTESTDKDHIIFTDVCTINATTSIDVWGALRAGQWQPISDEQTEPALRVSAMPPVLTLAAPYITLEAGSEVDGDTVQAVVQIAASRELQLLGEILAGYRRTDNNCSAALSEITPNNTCSLLTQTFSTAQPNWTPWSSLSISAGDLTLGTGASITGSVVVLCSDHTATLQAGAKLDTTGNGCPSGLGAGAGQSAQTANPGGGAGHGGLGGAGEPGGSGAGAVYDRADWPVMVGSGGSAGNSGGVGGAGGGLIYLSAGVLSLGSGVSIASDGNSGTGDKGSGGGSGGTVLLHIYSVSAPSNLSIHPTISAQGGQGTSVTDIMAAAGASAGGGGGGRIFVQWRQSPPIDQANDVQFTVAPGTSSENNGGELGTVVADPACPAGFSGVLCVGCLRGEFKNMSGSGSCLPCAGGSHTNATNSTQCELCTAGYFAPRGQPLCSACTADYYSGAGQANCTRCPTGEEANVRHIGCDACQMGMYKPDNGDKCIDCQLGWYSNSDRPNGCLQCPDLPSHAHYVSLPGTKCPYECDVGFLFPACLTPFNSMVQSIGGWVVFVGLLALSVAVTFVPFLCCFIRSKRRQRERELLEMDDAETESESDSLPPSPPSAQSKRLQSAVTAVTYDRSQLATSLLEPSASTHSLQDLPTTSLQPHHYPHHLHRIYLQGDNCWQRPLRLRGLVPSEVLPLVFDDEYGVFANDVSKRGKWRGWEQAVYVLLVLFCLPLAASWHRWRRSVHVRAVWMYVLNYDHSMLRNAKSRALASSLLFGCSSCHTLAWIDVLANHSEEREVKQTGLPCLPLTLIAAGDGSYHTPFHFDVSDAYNKVVSEYVGINYLKFLRAVNATLRPIRRTQLSQERAVGRLMEFLAVENHMGIGIGKHLPLGGVKVELGWVGADASVGGGMLPALVVTAKEELASTGVVSGLRQQRAPPGGAVVDGGRGGVSSRIPNPRFSRTDLLYARPPPFRRDDRSPQSSDSGRDAQMLSQSYNSAHSYLTSDEDEDGGQPSIMERALGQEGRKKVEAYLNAKQRMEAEQRRLQQKKSTSYASLPLPSNNTSHTDTDSTYHTFGAGGAGEVGGWGRATKSRQQHTSSAQSGLERKEDDEPSSLLDTSASTMSDSMPSQPLPYSASVYHFTPSRSSSAAATPTSRRNHLSLNSPMSRTHITSSLSSSLSITTPPPAPSVSISYRLQALALFNMSLYGSRTWLACVFLLLVLIRCGLSLVWLSSSYQLVRWLFWCSLALYPAAPVAVPLLGLAVLVSSSVQCCRLFACTVLLSLINDAVVVAGSAYSFNVQLGVIDALLLPALALASSLMMLVTAHAYVAHLEVLKDLVKGRRDYGKDREGEEGFIISNSPQSSRRGSRRGSLDDRATGRHSRHSSRDKRPTRSSSRRTTASTTTHMVEPQSSNSPYTPTSSSEPSTPMMHHARHDMAPYASGPDTPRSETPTEPLPIPFAQPPVSFAAPRGSLTPILSVGTAPMSPSVVSLPAATLPSPTPQMSMLSQSLAAQQQMSPTSARTAAMANLPAQSEELSAVGHSQVSAPVVVAPSAAVSASSTRPVPASNTARLPPAPRSTAAAAAGAAGVRTVRGASTAAGRGGARGGGPVVASGSPRVSPRTSATASPRGSTTASPRGKVKRGTTGTAKKT